MDCMLGKLAKWLKILGFDAVYFRKIEDDDLLDVARSQGRILLTRDNGIIERAGDVKTLFIDSEDWRDQIKQVLDSLGLKNMALPYSRCVECNEALKAVPKSHIKNLVPPFIYEHAESFSLCPRCDRVFWKGTHFEDMKQKLEQILSDECPKESEE
ncbi:Mut7-C RNAse domain-containing protein [Acidobacteriota bacterium]